MKTFILAGLLVTGLVGCSKKDEIDPDSYPCSTGNCNVTPPLFYYTIADKQGSSLLPPGNDGVSVVYTDNSQTSKSLSTVYPFVPATSPTSLLVSGSNLALLSEGGVKLFYLTFRGKVDTLGLDMNRDPTNTATGGHSIPIVTFNGHLMQAITGDPTYYVLKRR